MLSIIYRDKLRDQAVKGHSILLFSLAFFYLSMTIFRRVKICPTNKHLYPLRFFSVCLSVTFFLPPTFFFSVCLSVTFFYPLNFFFLSVFNVFSMYVCNIFLPPMFSLSLSVYLKVFMHIFWLCFTTYLST